MRKLKISKQTRWVNNLLLVILNTLLLRLLFPTAAVGVAVFCQQLTKYYSYTNVVKSGDSFFSFGFYNMLSACIISLLTIVMVISQGASS